jgi:uncharacterized protein
MLAMSELGHVVALWRYPVKSMAGESLTEVDVSWQGLAGDRRWAFIRDGVTHSNFPWLTIREQPSMCHYRPSFTDPDRPEASKTMVRTPTGADFDVVDPALAAELGTSVPVIKTERGLFDAAPLSLITTQTLAALGAMVGTELIALRFRPNLVVAAADDVPFQEDFWVGSVLRVGGMQMRVDQRDNRCVMVNVDPVTAQRNPAVLRAIARERQACLGVYGATVEPGRVAVGDPVSRDA